MVEAPPPLVQIGGAVVVGWPVREAPQVELVVDVNVVQKLVTEVIVDCSVALHNDRESCIWYTRLGARNK